MKATINGELRDVPDGMTMDKLLEHMKISDRAIAVAKNDHVVRRAAFANEIVYEGDRIEIIRAVAGG